VCSAFHKTAQKFREMGVPISQQMPHKGAPFEPNLHTNIDRDNILQVQHCASAGMRTLCTTIFSSQPSPKVEGYPQFKKREARVILMARESSSLETASVRNFLSSLIINSTCDHIRIFKIPCICQNL
jgi:hypothetical protein